MQSFRESRKSRSCSINQSKFLAAPQLVSIQPAPTVVHAISGWLALPAVLLLGARHSRYHKARGIAAHPPSSIPFLALGAWILTVSWFGFNVISAQALEIISGIDRPK